MRKIILSTRIKPVLLIALCTALLILCVSFGMLTSNTRSVSGAEPKAVPEGTERIEVTYAGGITDTMTYAQMKNYVTVTAYGEGDTELGTLAPDAFELVGDFDDGQNTTSDFTVTVTGTEITETVTIQGFTADRSAVRSISATYNGGGVLRSYTPINYLLQQSLISVTATTWEGTTRSLNLNNEVVLEGNLAPSTGGVNAEFSKNVTVRYREGGSNTNITCICEITGIQPAVPQSISVTPNNVVTALEPCAAGDLIVTVTYVGGMQAEIPFNAYSDSVQYMQNVDGVWEVDPDAEGYIYGDGWGRVQVTYSEAGTQISGSNSEYYLIQVSRVAVTQPTFSSAGSDYDYTDSDGVAVGEPQTISLNEFYDDTIMEIKGVSYRGEIEDASAQFNSTNGSITVTDAGSYTVTVALRDEAQAYFFRNDNNDDDLREIEITYKIYPVEPPIEIEWSENAYDGEDLKWDRDDIVSFELLKNYGNGEVTYTYRRTDDSTTTGTAEDPNLPNETGTYTLTVNVEANGNFAAFEGERVTFTVGQRVIGLPTLNNPEVNDGNLVYNGAEQEASITYAGGEGDEGYLDVTNAGGTVVGDDYTVTFTIKDQYADEAEWDSAIADSLGEGESLVGNTLTLTYQITKLSIAVPTFGTNGTITTPYQGSPNNGTAQEQSLGNWYPSAGFAQGETSPVTVKISGGSGAVSADSINGTVTATNAGSYTVTVSLGDTNDTNNLQWTNGTTADLEFEYIINKATVTIPDAGNKTYTSGALTSDLADTDFYTVSQETDWVNADDYDVTLSLTDATNYKWSDGREDRSITVTFTIDPLPVTIDWDESTFNFIYDGYSHVASASVGNKIGQDDVSFVIRGEQTNANTNGASYTATIESLTGDQAGNYTLTDASGSTTHTFTIAPRSIGIVWDTTTHVYDGESWHPEAASFMNVIGGDSVGTLTYDGAKTDAGTNYTVTVKAVSNPNYTVSGGTNISTTFTITPYEVDKPGEMANDDFTYTAAPQTYLPDGFNPTPFGEDTMTISGNVQTNAGTYTVTVSLASENYKWSDTDDRSAVVFTDKFVIAKAELTVTWTGTVTTYDGIAFTPSYSLSGWKEQDNASDYTWSWTITGEKVTDNSAVDAGSYHAVLLISAGESGFLNYYLSGNETDFVINKAQVDVSEIVSEPEGISGNEASDDRRIPFTENGSSHLIVTANPELYSIDDFSSNNDVGDYEVVLTLVDSDNYEWTGYIEAGAGVGIYDTVYGGEITIRYAITYQQFTLGIKLADTWVYGNDANNAPAVTNNLTGNTATFTYYTWDEDAQRFDEEGSSTLPTNVGRYLVVAEVDDGNNYAGTEARKEFTITPRTVTVKISVSDGTYGSWSGASIADISGNADSGYEQIEKTNISLIFESLTSGVELVNGIPQNAGSYSVTAQFATGANPNGNYTLAVAYTTDGAFTISPLVLTVTGWDGDTKVYAGQGSSYQPTVNDANVQEKFGDTLKGLGLEYTVTANEGSALSAGGLAVDVGSYTVKVTGIGNKNYTLDGATGTTNDFTITPYKISFALGVTDNVYGSFVGDRNITVNYTTETLNNESAEIRFSYTGKLNSTEAYTNKFEAGNYTVTATINNKNYTLAGGETELTYDFTIERATISDIMWADRTFTYNNSNQYDGKFATAAGVYGDGTLDLAEAITQKGVTAEFINAGKYTFTAGLKTEQAYNYQFAKSLALTNGYEITPAEISITLIKQTVTYNGTTDFTFGAESGKTYSITAGDTFGVDLDNYLTFTIQDLTRNADTYNVSGALDNPNFNVTGWINTTGAFEISPAKLEVEFTTFDGGTYGSANGTDFNVVSVLGTGDNKNSLDGSISYVGVESGDTWQDKASPAGEYTVTLTITNNNYIFENGTRSFTADSKLVVKKYVIESVTWAVRTFTYTGSNQYDGKFATAEGVNGDGTLDLTEAITQNGVTAEFKNAGEYTFTAGLETEQANNYQFAESLVLTKNYTINKAGLTLSGVQGYTGTYDGKAHNALNGGYLATTVDNSAATWHYRLTESEDWQTDQLTFTNAGEYTVHYKVTAANHKDATGSVTVQIDKKAISIAINGTITYGEALPDKGVGIDNNGTFTTKVTGDNDYADGEKFNNLGITIASITADGYEQGYDVGDYTLKWTFTGESTNYIVTPVDGILTVSEREITVHIKDITDNYNNDIKDLNIKDKTYSITGDTYKGEVPFTLSTTAEKGSAITTADRKYYIYPTVTNDNYSVTFTGSHKNVTINNVEYAAVGEYIIIPASTSITIKPPTSLVYSGKEKTHYAESSDGVELSVAYYEYTGNIEDWEANRNNIEYYKPFDGVPVNAGYYCVIFTSENENYEAANAMQSFAVTKKTITVDITAGTSVYDGLQHEAKISFSYLVEADEAGWEYNTHYILTYKGIEGTTYESADAPKNAGKYTVTVTLTEEGGKNYTLPVSSDDFEITKVELTVTAKDNTITYGDELSTITIEYTYDGFVPGESAEGLGVKPGFTTDYEPGDDAGSEFEITPKDVKLDNYNIKYAAGTLTVEKRAITVTINDQSLVYTGVTADVKSEEGVNYTISGNGGKYGNDDLIIVLSTNGINAGRTYAITGTAGGKDVNNYDITYSGSWENKAGTLTITQKALTIKAKDVDVTYGDDAVLSVDYIGLVKNENESVLGGTLAFTTANKVGGAPYEQGDSAGSTYTIKPLGLTSNNYDITFETGTLTVQKRVVTVNVKVYGDGQYNYGNAVPAVVTFNNVYVYDNGIVEHEVYYKGSANDGSVISNYGTKEPVKAGQYTAKVRITDNNYTFADAEEYSGEYDYTINKRTIDVNWENSVIAYTAGTNEYTNMLKVSSGTGSLSFADEVLIIVSQTVILGNGSISETASSSNNYTITVSSDISATPVGTYAATIQINASHFYNYTFDEGDATTITFEISADANILKFAEGADLSEILDWTYGKPGEWTLMKGLDEFLVLTYGNVSDVIFAYAVNTGVGTAETATYTSIRPTDAGEYYVRIYYPGSVSEDYGRTEFIYAEFTINKAVLTAPSLTENESAYIGSEMNNPVIGFDAQTMGISTSVNFTASGNNITLNATTVGTYEVIITLKQPNNYMWTDGTSAGITLSWKVTKALNNEITEFNIPGSWTYGDTVTISADAVFGTPVVYYVEYAEGDLPGSTEDLSSLSWSDKLPENTGRYLACAFVRDTNENYNDAWEFAIFEINNAELSVSATGYEGIYDGKSHNAVVSSGVTGVGGVTVTATWKFSNSQNGEYSTGMPIVKNATDGDKTIYYIVSAPNYNDYSGKITVNIEKKDLTIRVEDVSIIYGETTPSTFSLAHAGLVSGDSIPASGLTYKIEKDGVAPSETILPAGVYTVSLNPISALSNYDINYVSGKLNVASKNIAVNIEDQGSVYGEVISLDQSKVSVDTAQLVDGDTVADLGITLSKADGTAVGAYPITGTYVSANYVVVFVPGVYTISAKAVSVTITPNGGVYGGTITGATATVDGLTAADEGSVKVVLTYTGTAYDGTTYNGTEVPTKAGAYTVTATLDSANYTLTGVVSATFIVERAAVETPETAGSKSYTGSALKSDLADTSEYTVTQGEDWTNAGNYNVTLTLRDKNNYKWSTTGASDDVTVIFAITPAANSFTSQPSITGWTYSEDANKPYGAAAQFGTDTIVYMYSAEEYGEYTTNVPTEAGTYYVKAFIAATSNYAGAESDAVKFTIAKYTNNAISGLTFADSWVYNTTPSEPSASATFGTVQYKYAADDGSTAAEDITEWSTSMPTSVGNYWICAYVDGTDNYNGAAEYKQFTITPATITVTGVEGYTGTYDGTAHSGRTGGIVTTVDGSAATWEYSLTGSGNWQTAQFTFTNAGTYTVYYKVTAANHNAVTGSFNVNINKASLTVIVGNATINYGEDAPSTFDVTYSGFVGTDSESDLGGALVFDVNGYSAGSDAGTYTVKASGLTSDNYVITYTDGTLQVVKINATVTITPNGGVYGGTITGATATVDGLIAADEGSVNVVLTYTGTAYDGTTYNGTEVPTKAGAYTVTATLDSDNYTLTGVTTAAFIVERATVTVPDAGSKTYTGSTLKSDLADTSEYTVTQGDNWTAAGNYNVTLTLKDKNNYKWSTTNASDDVTVIFAITQATNSFTSQPSITGWTYSEDANAPGGAEALFGTDTIVYMYSAAADGEYTTTVPTEAGTYYVKAFIAATDNYAGAESDAVEFTIVKYTSNAISGLTFADSWVYNTTPSEPSASATFGTVQYKYAADDGSTLPGNITNWSTSMPTSVGDYWICAYVDGTDNYNGAAEYKQFTITPATITVTGVEGYTGTYDGTAHSGRTGGIVTTVDGSAATWEYSLTGSGDWQTTQFTFTNAGTYTVYYRVIAANHNAVTGSFNVNINKASLIVIVGNDTVNYGEDAPSTFDVTYNGFVGTDSESDLGGALVFDVNGYSAGSDAGTYTVKASGLTSDNYVITYTDGTLQVVKINATVTITPNGGVYGGMITGATATVSGLIAADEGSVNAVLTYTGTAYDGTQYNGTEVPTKAGAYTVTATLDSANYTLTGVVSATFIVERAAVTVPDAGSKTYTGSALKSDLTDTSEYTVTQGEDWTNAGNYNVTLTLRDKNNYKWSTTGASDDVTVIFAITQAANSFTSQPVINGWTYSEDANAPGGAAAHFGTDTIVYMYSAEEYGEYTTNVPTEAGTYYVKAFITETSNYTGAESDAVMFTIAKYTSNAISGLTFESSWVYNTTPTAPSASAAFGTVQYKYAVDDGSTPAEGIAEWSDVMPTAAGSYWICAYVDGTDNYNGAVEYKQFTITPATLTVTGVAGYSGTYDGTAHSGRTGGIVTTVDGSAATWQYSLTGSGDWQTTQFTFTDAGTYTVYYKVTAANHSDVTGSFNVNINKANLTVIVGNATINYGEDAPSTFDVTYNGFVGTDSESDLGGALVFDVNGYSAGSDAGTYTVKASGLTSDNYVITYTDGTLQVVKINATVTITPNGGVYGGTITGATATVDGLIAADEGSVNVVLTYTGTAYDGTQYNGTEVPTKAGAYTVTATLDSANYTLTGVTTAAFIVERATVTVPDAGSKPFAGSALKSDLADTSEYTVTQGDDWTNAGNYNVTLTLRDKNNYKWSTTNASDDVTVIFAITQAANSFTSQPSITGWTYSEDANKPYGAAAHFGTDTIVYMYSAEEYGEYTTTVPAEAGTYYVKAFIAATNNYAGAESDAVMFTIAKYTNNAISGLTFADSWVYGKIPTAPSASATFGTVQYKYAADDGSTLPEDIAVWSTAIPKSVGDYWICAYVDGTDNYNGAAEYKQFTITPATLTVTGVAGYNGTYDGTAHSGRTGGIVTTVDGSAATWEYSLTGSGNWQTDQFTFKNAGTYTVYYRVIAANHNAVTGSFNVNINKASLTVIVGNATINYGEDAPGTFEVTYNGFVGTDSESDLGGAIKFSVKDYVPGAPANSYIVSASGLTSDNYDITYRNGILFVTSITITATITPNGGVYGGTIIGATATLNGVPAGADIEPILTYTGTAYDGTIYNSTEVPTKAGSYTVTVSLSDDSYTLSGVTSSIFTIERATVTVPDAGSKTYTGSALKSDLADTSEYTVAQGEDWTNAGNYNVTLTLRDKNNYKWSTTGAGSDVTVTFTITQAENKFTAQPVINGWTYSEDANAPGGAEALFGTETIVYMYSAAADGEYTTTVPTEAGTYYVKAFITETSNYTGAESDAVMFEIVIHADAATPELEFETSVYSGAEQTNEITGYDASIMSMTGTAAVSTSDGIAALKATNAGVYTVTITFKNDNYTFSDGSTSVTLSWTISRQSVDKPVEAEGEWIIADGNTFEYIPVGFDDDLMKITGNKITEPGNYTVTVTLRDTNNYVWDDGTDDPVVFSWSVAEKEISLLWLIILLIVVIVIEIILLIAGIVRRRKSDNDGSGDGAGKGNAGFAAAMAFTVMSDVIIPSHLTACCVLGGIAVILLVCVLIVYLKKKKSAEDKQHAKKADPAEANVKAEQNGKDNADKK